MCLKFGIEEIEKIDKELVRLNKKLLVQIRRENDEEFEKSTETCKQLLPHMKKLRDNAKTTYMLILTNESRRAKLWGDRKDIFSITEQAAHERSLQIKDKLVDQKINESETEVSNFGDATKEIGHIARFGVDALIEEGKPLLAALAVAIMDVGENMDYIQSGIKPWEIDGWQSRIPAPSAL